MEGILKFWHLRNQILNLIPYILSSISWLWCSNGWRFSNIINIFAAHFLITPLYHSRAVEDFLIHDLYLLAALAEQNNNSGKLKQVRYNWIELFCIRGLLSLHPFVYNRVSPRFSLSLIISVDHGWMDWNC